MHFIFEDAGDLKKRVGACSEWDKKKGFQFREKHFDPREFEKTSQEINEAARTSGKERASQLKCILNLKLSEIYFRLDETQI